MSEQITTARVNQYSAQVQLLSQQIGSRLRPFVTMDNLAAQYGYFDQVGSSEVKDKTSRNSDLVLTDTPFDRRRVSMLKRYAADSIDKSDKLRMVWDPTGPYARSQAAALGRKMDKIIIDAATDTAYTGESGGTSTAFDTTNNRVAVTYDETNSSSTTNTNLTIGKLRKALEILWGFEAVMDGEEICCALGASQVQALLRTTEVTSSDYNTVKALVNGAIDSFLGMKFVRTEQLNTSSTYTRVLVFPKSAIKMAIGEDISSSVDEMPEKGKGTFLVQSWFEAGATRMEEKKVVDILCDETV